MQCLIRCNEENIVPYDLPLYMVFCVSDKRAAAKYSAGSVQKKDKQQYGACLSQQT